MTRRERAIELRNMALAVLRACGGRTEAHAAGRKLNLVGFDRGGLKILYRTPFQKLPKASERVKYFAALHGVRNGGENLPYGLDIWRNGKVLNIEWADDGRVELVSYKPGSWEGELERLANDNAV
jgi:hypothetical protein